MGFKTGVRRLAGVAEGVGPGEDRSYRPAVAAEEALASDQIQLVGRQVLNEAPTAAVVDAVAFARRSSKS